MVARRRLGFFSAALLLVALTSPLRAQPADPGEVAAAQEAKNLKDLDEERAKGAAGRGLVMIGVTLKGKCSLVIFTVARRVDGKMETEKIRARGGPGPYIAGFRMLPAGAYILAGVQCDYGREKNLYKGPFARFQVKSGEFVNLASLQLTFNMERGFLATGGESHRAIVPADSAALGRLKKASPRLAARMVTRPMTLIGPESVKVKRQ